MQDPISAIGNRVYVTSYGPLGGLRGTIRAVHPVVVASEEPWYFYLVKLEGIDLGEPIWLEQDQVEAVAPLTVSRAASN
jgi:hypothetical protein